MSYRLKPGETAAHMTRRVAKEQIREALLEIRSPETDDAEKVHQLRKRCKKIRGLLRLARPAMPKTYDRENARFRDLARKFSELRDAKTQLTTLDHIASEIPSTDSTELTEAYLQARQLLQRERADLREARSLKNQDDRCRNSKSELQSIWKDAKTELQQALGGIDNWKWRDGKPGSFESLGEGLQKTLGRAHDAMRTATEDPSTDHMHQWRKRVKYHWYHLRLLQPIWKQGLAGNRDDAKKLAEALGDLHDVDVLGETLRRFQKENELPSGADQLIRRLDERRNQLSRKALRRGRRLFAESPAAFSKRCRVYWKLARNDA
ncbi:CHAD domain-containing protein [Crateriforma conspicua]|uniref:CHAD domain-containing protein n=1 Tax=Crateriforma conspicua TaxID=2527996 RepID=UPI00118AFD81|nr:CHAD domain-containing protein [Crateriforma conspicua]QDV64842.1 CHAD domain protein [Crateriforma conspicua]